jgi:cation diffusion facilitator CzcD-associated flavoprotein CzcO
MMKKNSRVAIIGAGFGGIAAAIELKSQGFEDLTIFESREGAGGVWRANTYPGAACDVPSPYYCFSFEQNPAWPHRFSHQPAILDYVENVVDKYDLRRHLVTGTEVTEFEYSDAHQVWTLKTGKGEVCEFDAVVAAVGQLSTPSRPNLPGIDSFAGESFHSAEWPDDVDLRGKKVAVVGTGASAIQFVPEVQKQAGQLTVFQRSAPFLVPRPDVRFGAFYNRLLEKVPGLLRTERGGAWALTEIVSKAFLSSPLLSKAVTGVSRAHMALQLRDKELLDKLWPDYPVGCKRLLFSNSYLPALRQKNVEVVTASVSEVTPTGVIDADGRTYDADVIIYGTGFTATDFLAPMQVTGREGTVLSEEWADGAHAYLGVSMPKFPNLFFMYGPNTNVGSGSVIFMHEQQAKHIAGVLTASENRGAPLEVKAWVEAAFDMEMQDRTKDSVWTKCANWYTSANGRSTNNWPGSSLEYRRRTATVDLGDYETVKAREYVSTKGAEAYRPTQKSMAMGA